MKKIKNLLAMFSAAAMLSACAGDWLDTAPTDSIDNKTAFQTTENAEMAINGICKMMTMQYMRSQGFNGEGTIKMYYGNYPAANFFVNLGGWSNTINGRWMDNTASKYDYYPWYYYYKLVGNANAVLESIDQIQNARKDDVDFIKAQALTFRAYSFMMLAQLYGNRWVDSNNGATSGLVLRLDTSMGDMPLSTLAQTYQQIYQDLDNAIGYFKGSSRKRDKDDNYSPDLNVAYATYARAALNRQDYATAKKYAVLAREGYPLMSVKAYQSGFNAPTSEWIWSSYGSLDETLYYYSYFAYIGYSSAASAVRNYPKCIGRELYQSIPATDIRRDLFLDPRKDKYITSTGNAKKGTALYNRAFQEHPNMNNRSKVFAYMQFKIDVADQPGVGHLNHFRSSEMYLIEAEACHFLNDDIGAQKALIELTKNSGRDPEYDCQKTGDDLMNEIKKYRAIELWGEGFEWFDLKRWKDTIDRKTYKEGGNFISSLAVTIKPEDNNHWTWRIPLKETDYNTLIGGGSDPAKE